MSITIYLLPTASFLDIIEANNCALGSILSIFSILIIFESAGTNSKEPPHTRQAPVFFTIFFNSFVENSTLAIAPITSAVPAALVIAFEEDFGKVNPAAAHIETTMGLFYFRGFPQYNVYQL